MRGRVECGYGVPVLLALACALAGCATPDLQPFAEQTARLALAVSGEQREIALKLDRVILLYDEACSMQERAVPAPAETPRTCRRRESRKEDVASYAESRRVIDGVLEKSVLYSTSLAELAASGESGGEAAQSLLASLRQFGGLVGVGGTAVSETVATTLGKISTAVTRVQAQKSLAEATAAAQPAIVIIADGIRELHAASDKFAGGLHSDELDALLQIAGPDRVGLFRDAALGINGLGQRLNGLQLANLAKCGKGADPTKCGELPEVLRSAETLSRVLDQLRPGYDAYQTKRAAALRWRAERSENLAAVARAAAAWQAEHAKAAELLARCGGLNAYRCARLDAAALKAAVDQINEIRSARSR